MKNIYNTSSDELIKSSRIPLAIYDNATDICLEFAIEMIAEIEKNNKNDEKTVFICPCGPVEQYKTFAKLVNALKISLKNT